MSRPERIFELCQLLAGRRPLSVREIAERFEISLRTAYRDLELLGHRLPVASDERGYRILETAALRPLLLTVEERLLLELALDHPALRGRPRLAVRLRSLEAKLHSAQHSPPPIPSPWSLAALDRTGTQADLVLAALERATAERRACDAAYVSLAGGSPRRRRLHPLRLFLRADVWYLAAFAPEHEEVRTFRLDRFDEVRLLDERFEPPAFDLDAYLADSWELFRGDGDFAVHLRFDPSLAPLLLRGRQHPKEVVEGCDDGIHYRVEITHLDELARWIVGFGGKAVVVEPEALRKQVIELARGAVKANEIATPSQSDRGEGRAQSPRRIARKRIARN